MSSSGFVPADLQHFRQALRPVHVVIDHQYATADRSAGAAFDLGSRARVGSRSVVLDEWEPNAEGTSLAETESSGAVIVPPCSSTSRLTRARPMPSPPCERSSVRFTWVNISNTSVSIVGRDAKPGVRDADNDFVVLPYGRQLDAAALGRVLGSVGEQVAHDLGKRVGSASSQSGSSGRTSLQRVPRGVNHGSARLDGDLDHGPQQYPLFPEVSLSFVIRDASSRSSMSRTMWESWRSIILRVSMAAPGPATC